jgi:autophagy-related protein 13
MDFQNNMQPELGKLEQIVYQFLLKCLHIILDSRVASIRQHDRSGDLSTGGSRVRRSDKWFNFALGDRPSALDNLNFWHRNLMDPMIIDIILVHEENGSSVETVIERWNVQYECPRVMAPQISDSTISYKKTYQKSIILFRALYSQMRLLPTHKIFRQLSSSNYTCNFDIVYKVSSFSDPFSREEGAMMEEYIFTPVDALPGRLSLSVTYRSTLSDFNLQCSTSLPTKIITDYVGSPNTDPLRYFPSSVKGVRVPPSSSPLDRPHSWTPGFHKAAPFVQNHQYVGSPPVHRGSLKQFDFPSPPTDNFNIRYHNHRIQSQSRSTSYDEHQLSPPFSSSLSPSPPIHSGNTMHTRMRSETAPVSIPHPIMGKSSRNLSPNFSDPNRNSLPPLSPRRNDASSNESPSGIRSFRKIESLKFGQKVTLIGPPFLLLKLNQMCFIRLISLCLLRRLLEIARRIQGGSQHCYLLVTHHVLEFLEPQANYLFRMTWTMVTFHVLLMLMMLTLQMFCQGTLIDFTITTKLMVMFKLTDLL